MPRRGRGWATEAGADWRDHHSSLIVSMMEPALLVLLGKQSRHGYTLIAELTKLDMSTIHPSVVYRSLRNMEVLGWIESDWDANQTQGPPRRNYHLTEEGRKALQYWKAELNKTNGIILQLLENT